MNLTLKLNWGSWQFEHLQIKMYIYKKKKTGWIFSFTKKTTDMGSKTIVQKPEYDAPENVLTFKDQTEVLQRKQWIIC